MILFKYEYLFSDLLIPYIGFELFHPYTGKKLDISICENTNINYYIPVNINEDKLYIYNKSDDYYKDRCLPATTENGTDVILYDRKNEFNNKHLSVCAKGCNFIQYNSTTKNVLCECNAESNPLELNSLIDKEKLLNNFIDIKMISNIGLFLCYKTLFVIDGIITNIGNYFIFIVIISFLVASLIFYRRKEEQAIINLIKEIIESKKSKINKNNIITPINYVDNKDNKNNEKNNKIVIKNNENQIVQKKKKYKKKKEL